MLILLTNDDGIRAPGLKALYRELLSLGEVHVVAPETVQSATGHGITISTPLLTQQVTIDDGVVGIAVEGRPADCVKLAVSQILPRQPDLVISGLNSGANVGINVIYSGTVAAALEAAFLGLPAIACSLYLRDEVQPDYETASRRSVQTIRKILDAGLEPGQIVSVNIPALRAGEREAGTRVVRQCTRAWIDTYDRRTDPRGREYFWNSSIFKLGETDDDTDVAALRDGYVTITPLQFDMTHFLMLRDYQSHDWNG
jgi:5'-nucleotidase